MSPDLNVPGLPDRLAHVYWLGGGSGAGKSTIAQRLADRHGLKVYSTDTAMADHARRCTVLDCPLLEDFKKMDMDERWVNRSPHTMLETFPWFRGEGLHLIVEDLLALPDDEPVIAEGFRLLPKFVRPLLTTTRAALWLIPTPDFRAAALKSRGDLWTIANRTSDPESALQNLLERDGMFTRQLHEDATAAGLTSLQVDTDMTEAALTDIVETHFRL